LTSQTDRYGLTSSNIFAIKDSKDFGLRIAAKVRDLGQVNQGTPFALHYANVGVAYTHLYGLDIEGVGANAAVVTRSGDQGSIAEMRIPAAAGDLRKVWNIIVGPELAWTAVATTTDYGSEAQAITAKNALQYYWADKGVGALAKAQALQALSFAEAALHVPWNDDMGEDIAFETLVDSDGRPRMDDDGEPQMRLVKTGDVDFRPISTWDIIRDPSAKSFDSLEWVVVREWQNKFDVAARCKDPDVAAAALTTPYQPAESYRFWRPFNIQGSVQSDLIPVYYLYHRRTASVWQGRQTEFLESGAIISDAPLDKAYWKQLPVVRMAVGEYAGTPFPYSKFFAVLGSAQAADGLARDLLTNATATSGGVIIAEDDSNTPPLQLGGGPKVIYKPKGAADPKPLELQQSHPEHFKLLSTFRGESKQILGLDRLTAGEDIGTSLSGAAMALMTSTSVQNNSQEQAAWGKFVQDIGNVVLAHIQHHMKEPRRIALAGRSRADLVTTTELSGTAVAGIDRLQVQLAPALQQTDAGKMQMAEMAIKEKWAQTPQQIQTVLDTGRLDALTQDLSNELMLIQSENEAMSKGQQVEVMLGDDHLLHLRGHRPVTASITARQNPQVVQALQAHEAAHLKILQTTDPKILQVFQQPSLAPTPPPQEPKMADATKLGATNLAVKAGWAASPQAAQQVFETGKIDAAAAMVNPAAAGNPPPGSAVAPQQQAQGVGARMPRNPATGQPAGPVAGTPSPALAVKPPTAPTGQPPPRPPVVP
jgi:hypothetical protein